MSKWKPINTAPKDGHRVLLYDRKWSRYAFIGEADKDLNWSDVEDKPEYPDFDPPDVLKPTHWREIPDGPFGPDNHDWTLSLMSRAMKRWWG